MKHRCKDKARKQDGRWLAFFVEWLKHKAPLTSQSVSSTEDCDLGVFCLCKGCREAKRRDGGDSCGADSSLASFGTA